ncbi:hypothetical protein A5320_17145 [Rheinheimera sp. SA_1]|uniref:CRISPR-associated helicase/endonuclease Cas3 n=1 Tax=Rheinheimera sp. SA_1 TaxID=1827365 RepID=UPI0007FD849E|nr:CRISPR-associated helicase/endonuclease Cas3 [Rheinheimera sp. SA_1]OBP13651.1 hypothetical protein A5320_17145 [Rheinheimera sp. SA_1]
MTTASYMGYWGKAKKDPEQAGPEYHLLAYHSLDVAAVGWQLLNPDNKLCQELADFLQLQPAQLQSLFTFALAIHDLGKFTGAFQALKTFDTTDLHQFKVRRPYDGAKARHDMLGWALWRMAIDEDLDLLQLTGLSLAEAKIDKGLVTLFQTTWGHHGKPVQQGRNVELEDHLVDANIQHATEFIKDVASLFKPQWSAHFFTPEIQQRFRQISWHLAGIGILADWVGSDTCFFQYQKSAVSLADYWLVALDHAKLAVADTGLFDTFPVEPFSTFKQQFGFEPTPLQQWAAEVPIQNCPQLFVLEDVTGAGKTEAALTLTQRIMAADLADGFYFGLPSMATSNAMFKRILRHYHQMYQGNAPSIVLAHGARDMEQSFRDLFQTSAFSDADYLPDEPTATAVCHQWFADSRKKALLAPVGVGTLDQALLAVLPRRHQALRMIGLHRKVLIFDEVHAADEYMLVLLQDLLQLHARQGGSVILLTATLAERQRKELITRWLDVFGLTAPTESNNSFPLATQVGNQSVLQSALSSREDVCRQLQVVFLHSVAACLARVEAAVSLGQSIVWIRNSVADALTAYQLVSTQFPGQCLLFHSRFTLLDRQTTESSVLTILGKTSTVKERAGKIIITTQVFQESLDADADVMISDICPIDDLIQRAGRLHRHTRDTHGCYQSGIQDQRQKPVLYLHCPEFSESPDTNWLSAQFRNTELVYRSPGRLWLGLRVLMQHGAIRMPEDARLLIESVYGEKATHDIPEALQTAEQLHFGEIQRKTNKAMQQTIDWYQGYCADSHVCWGEDDSEISTRYSDMESVEVIVLKREESGQIILWAYDQQNALALSKLKLPKHQADKLQNFSESHSVKAEQLKAQFKQARFTRFWLAEDDQMFCYSTETGFSKK